MAILTTISSPVFISFLRFIVNSSSSCESYARLRAEDYTDRQLSTLESRLRSACPVKTGRARRSIVVRRNSTSIASFSRAPDQSIVFEFEHMDVTWAAAVRVPYARFITSPWFVNISRDWAEEIATRSLWVYFRAFKLCRSQRRR